MSFADLIDRPKQQHRFFISFGNTTGKGYEPDDLKIPPEYVKSVDLPTYEIGNIQLKHFFSHTYNFPKRLVWRPITLTLIDYESDETIAKSEIKRLTEIAREKGSESVRQELANLREGQTKNIPLFKEKDYLSGAPSLDDVENYNKSTQLVIYKFLQNCGYFSPLEGVSAQAGSGQYLRLKSYPFKDNMIYNFTQQNDKFNLLNGKNTTPLYFSIHQVNPRGFISETWQVYNPLITEVKTDKLSYGSTEVLTYTLNIVYEWARLVVEKDDTSQVIEVARARSEVVQAKIDDAKSKCDENAANCPGKNWNASENRCIVVKPKNCPPNTFPQEDGCCKPQKKCREFNEKADGKGGCEDSPPCEKGYKKLPTGLCEEDSDPCPEAVNKKGPNGECIPLTADELTLKAKQKGCEKIGGKLSPAGECEGGKCPIENEVFDGLKCVCPTGFFQTRESCTPAKKSEREEVKCGDHETPRGGICYCDEGYFRLKKTDPCKEKIKCTGNKVYEVIGGVTNFGKCVCPINFEPSGDECVAAEKPCKAGRRRVGGRCICKEGYVTDDESNERIPCVKEDPSKQPDSITCGTNTRWDEASRACVCTIKDGRIKRTGGRGREGGVLYECEDLCRGAKRRPSGCYCEEGYKLFKQEDGTFTCNEICGDGLVYEPRSPDANSNGCRCYNTAKTLQGGTCVNRCTGDLVWNGKECVCSDTSLTRVGIRCVVECKGTDNVKVNPKNSKECICISDLYEQVNPKVCTKKKTCSEDPENCYNPAMCLGGRVNHCDVSTLVAATCICQGAYFARKIKNCYWCVPAGG